MPLNAWELAMVPQGQPEFEELNDNAQEFEELRDNVGTAAETSGTGGTWHHTLSSYTL